MKKSGLADSPFFTPPQTKTEATPPSPKEPEVPTGEVNTNYQPQSPTPINSEEIKLEAQSDNNQDQKRTNVLSDVRTNERPNERTTAKLKRQKIRHAFDIYQDQLFNLQMKQLEAVQRGKRKPKLGKMVQDAIDLYLKQSQKRNK